MNTSSILFKQSNLRVADTSIPLVLALEQECRPRWLLNEYSSNTWVVTDTGDKPNKKISFDLGLPNGKRLTNYPNLLESIKRVVYGIRTGPLMSAESGTVQHGIANNLTTLAQWMVSNEIFRFDDLAIHDVRDYCDLAIYGVNAILNAESLITQYIEGLVSLSNFEDVDTPSERRTKALTVVPHYLIHNKTPVLHRIEVMKRAGLEGIPPTGALSQMMDEFEAICEFYQYRSTRNRMARASAIDEFDDKTVTTEHLRRLLMPFDYLYRHRRYLDDGITHNLFSGSSPSKVAFKLGKTVGRTGTIPVQQATFLIERSVRWVVDYAPVLLAMKDAGVEVPANLKNAPGNPFPILAARNYARHEYTDEIIQVESLRDGMTLPTAMNFLMVACAIVIAAFTGRRAAEILGLKADCIEYDDSGRPWLRIFIHKTTQGITTIPVPEAVTAAVSILQQLSASARMLNGSAYLFQYQLPGSSVCRGLNSEGIPVFRFSGFLRQFGYFIDVPALQNSSRWTFRPHQFRRFFAILYIWIYELGDWGALSYHLRHFNPEMTRRYVSDEELGQILAMANREHTAQILANAAFGKISVSGIEGTRLKEAVKRLHDRMIQHLHVVPERKFIQRVMRLVERTDVTLRALPWGYCATTPNAPEGNCACDPIEKSTPNLAAATLSSCKDCAFGFRTPAFLPYLKSSLKLHQDVAKAKDIPVILRNASDALSLEIREYIESVEPFEEGTLP